MKKIMLLTTTPTVGGNGDALIAAAMDEAVACGAEASLIHIRERQIGFCQACYGCAESGVCVQKDDFMDILYSAHEADAIIAEAPIYYNCMAAQMMTVHYAVSITVLLSFCTALSIPLRNCSTVMLNLTDSW